MPFRSVADVAAAEDSQGRLWRSMVWKTSTPAGRAQQWTDLSVGPGIPVYNAYVGNALAFTALTGVQNRSIYPGPGIAAGQTRHVATVMAQSSSNVHPIFLLFADYLGFYPLVDTDSLDVQSLDNTNAITRYTDGDGVRAFMVAQVPQTDSAQANCTITYTNQAGTSGRTVTFGLLGSAVIGGLCNQANPTSIAGFNAMSPLIPLQGSDRGIRSIQSVQLSAGIAGFANIVLCRPLFDFTVPVNVIAAEKQLLRENAKLPTVLDGAFLQCLAIKQSAGSIALMAQLDFIWS